MPLTIEQARERFPSARFEDGAVIRSGARIEAGARIGKDRKNVSKCVVLNGFNHWGITGYLCDDGLIINIGCMNDYRGLPPDETRAEIAKKYPPGHIYFDCITLIEKMLGNAVESDHETH